jgi:hypothetical protein
MLNFVENLLENERGPMNDQDLTKTDDDPDRSLVLIEGLSHFLTNFLQNLASCQTSFRQVFYRRFKNRGRNLNQSYRRERGFNRPRFKNYKTGVVFKIFSNTTSYQKF